MTTTFAELSDPGLLVAIVGAFLAAACAGLAFLRPASDATSEAIASTRIPAQWRLLWPLVLSFEVPAGATISARRTIVLQQRLRHAGLASFLSPARYRAACWSAALIGAGFALLAPVGGLYAPGFAALTGSMMVVARVRDRAEVRKRALLRQLPFYLDLITMAVEAGLSLSAALAQAVDRGPTGPMRDELGRLLSDLRAGRAREEALRAMADRLQEPAIGSLVAALSTAQKQGASLGPILRAQAEQRRTERFLRAEKLAMEAPVKMLLPLALFIFPGTFVILLFPVVSRLIAQGIL